MSVSRPSDRLLCGREFMRKGGIEERIRKQLEKLEKRSSDAKATGKVIRALFEKYDFPPQIAQELRDPAVGNARRENSRPGAQWVQASNPSL